MILLPKSNSHIWSVADQVLVSGCNFLIGIALARLLGLTAFGVYAVAQMYLLYANTFQQSLVSSPMMTALPAEINEVKRAELVSGFFGYSLVVLTVVSLLLQLLVFGIGQLSPGLNLTNVAVPLSMALIGYQLQDWLRRVLYARFNNQAVFFCDVVAYVGQLTAIIIIDRQGALTVAAALWTMALSFSVSALLVITSQRLCPSWIAAKVVVNAHWRNSRNLLISSQLQWLASSGVVLVGAGFIGSQAAGGIRVAQNLLGPVNVVFQWMDNVMPVRASMLLREHGLEKVRSYLLRIGLGGCAAIAAFTLALVFFDEWLMVTVYGEVYRVFAVLSVFQAVYYLFGHSYRMLSYLSRATGRTGELARASTWWAVVAVLVALGTVHSFAERGVMSALIAGEIAGVCYLLWQVCAARRRNCA